jgi:hypothetical protein
MTLESVVMMILRLNPKCRSLRLGAAVLIAALLACSSPNPAGPPAPPAELPTALRIPSDLSLNVTELAAPGGAPALTLKAFDSADVLDAIHQSADLIEVSNDILDIALSVVSRDDIPVDPTVTTFLTSFPSKSGRPVRQDRLQAVRSGRQRGRRGLQRLHLPVGCLADGLDACPSEAPVADLQPICFRIWLDDRRFMAGLFDRVPTVENPESGRIRMDLTPFIDVLDSPIFENMTESKLGVVYDHRNPRTGGRRSPPSISSLTKSARLRFPCRTGWSRIRSGPSCSRRRRCSSLGLHSSGLREETLLQFQASSSSTWI